MEESNYVIISPARNEAATIEKTIDSVVNQTWKPGLWVIVNDGSTDETARIAMDYSEKYDWISVVEKEDRGFDHVGKGVIQAFNYGFRYVENTNWDFIVKLDCDLSFPPDYFETLFREFSSTDNLGVCGGTAFTVTDGALTEEKMPHFHPVAAARMYSRGCFDEIGGLLEVLGWDTIDLLRAQMLGWRTRRLPELKINHHRKMASRNGLWEGKVRTGRNFYITGYHPLFLLARCLYRLKERPYFVESFGVLTGYVKAMIKKEVLVVTEKERNFLRRQHLKRLLGISPPA